MDETGVDEIEHMVAITDEHAAGRAPQHREREIRERHEMDRRALYKPERIHYWAKTEYLLSIIDAERARADMAVEDLALATRVKDNLRALARDLAACVRDSYGMLAVHHLDMTETDALLTRAAAILETPRG